MNVNYLSILIILLVSSMSFAQSGFTVTSVSTSFIVSKNTNPEDVYWIINTQLNGGGQSITGSIDPSTIKGFTDGKIYTDKTLFIAVDTVNEDATYDIINEGISIYKYSLETFDAPQNCPLGICYTNDNPQPCSLDTDWDIPLGDSFFDFAEKRYCIKQVEVGTKGVYNNPVIGFNADITLSVGGTPIKKKICSGSISGCDGSSVDFDGVATATWSGSLITGESAPNQDNFVAIKKSNSNEWQIVRKSDYESYFPLIGVANSNFDTIKNTLSGTSDILTGDIEINNALQPINLAADNLLSKDTSFTSSPFTKDSNTGKITVPLKRSLTSPNVVFRVRGNWIGIVIPSGEPKILNVNSETFGSGEEGTINVQVQNIGEVDGTFSAQLVNCNPFVQSTSSQTSRKTLGSGDVDTIQIFVNGGSLSEDITKTCEVEVYDVNEPSIRTKSSVTLELEEAKVCIPNKEFADGNVIKKCNEDGSAIIVIENCEYGVTSSNGKFTCSINPEEREKYQCTENSDCGNFAYCNQNIHVCVQKSECINVINNGNSATKIDVAFVGDGYTDNEELRSDVLKIVDFNAESNRNGLMSVEPFKSNKNKFNIWMIKADNKIPLDTQYYQGPDRKKSLEIASECTSADYKIVMSKKSFRSYAFPSGGDAYLSLARSENQWGRLFLHEFGHAFGKLADEYVDPVIGNRPTKPNCAPDLQTAQSWWGNVIGAGFFEGCSYVESNIRSTFNSIMRHQMVLKDDFGKVNEIALLNILNKYT